MNIRFNLSIPMKGVIGPNETKILYCDDFRDLIQDEGVMTQYGVLLSKPKIYRILKNCNVGEVDNGMYLLLAEGEIDNMQSLEAFLKFLKPLIDAPIPTYSGYFHVDGELAPWLVVCNQSEIATFNTSHLAETVLRESNYLRDVVGFHECVKWDDGTIVLVYEVRKTIKLMGEEDGATQLVSVEINQ